MTRELPPIQGPLPVAEPTGIGWWGRVDAPRLAALRAAGLDVRTAIGGAPPAGDAAAAACALWVLADADASLDGALAPDAAAWRAQPAGLVVLSAAPLPAALAWAERAAALALLPWDASDELVQSTLRLALAQQTQRRELQRSRAGLEAALHRGREIAAATGLWAARHELSTDEAFARLRRRARDQRRRLEAVAAEALAAHHERLQASVPAGTGADAAAEAAWAARPRS
jgi:AmiR/NasT family two-component response regulator